MEGKMKKLEFLVVFTVVTLLCMRAYAFTASYEQTTTGPGMESQQVSVVKIKDDKVRMEMDSSQGRGIAIIDGDTMYSYNPADNVAVKLNSPKSADMKVLSNYVKYLESINAKVVGSARLGPYNCDIYEFVDPRINMPSKVWIWKAHNFPVKVEMDTPSGTMTTIMKNVKVGIPIDDSEFRLPAGVKIMDAPGMTQ
jgi:outer membrane lipoprotein-sorting protein